MDPMSELKQTFFQECEELLIELETGLLSMDEGGADDETINAVFRAVHSIKGGAGAFGLDALVKFAHKFETTLDEVRAGRLESTPDVLKVFLRSTDVLSDLVRAARTDEDVDDARTSALISELAGLTGTDEGEQEGNDPEATEEEAGFAPMALDLDFEEEEQGSDEGFLRWSVFFKPKPGLYASANETLLLIRELERLGDIVSVDCDLSALPDLNSIDPEGAYLGWRIEIETPHSEQDICEVFEFVDDECDLSIGGADSDASVEALDQVVVETSVDEIEVVAEEAPIKDAAAPKPATAEVKEVTAEKKAAPKEDKAAKSGGSTAGKSVTPSIQPTIRVDLHRVDRLINLVGELVINQAVLAQTIQDAGMNRAPNVEFSLEEFKHLTRDLQESVMALRAQPVRTLFQRMSRIVREAGEATDKNVRLVTDGEATEIDKTVIERLSDPLTHMIRNAVDHGVESPEDRKDRGKSAQGEIRLSAAHRSGRVHIEVSDDGAGINRERVRSIAIEKGLVSEEANLTDAEIDNLILMPGFSTAKEVSNLSGRGVGMDVVKQSIAALGGKLSISATPGKGSTFNISLPLTLAILDGMVVQVAGETIVVPLTAIVETLKPQPSDIHGIGDAQVMSIRGEYVPLIDVGLEMGYREESVDPTRGVVLSVETDGGARSALVVDAIQDQRQVVIKSLEENYGTVPGVAAATILGDGRIALILDVDGIIARTSGAHLYQETPLAATG